MLNREEMLKRIDEMPIDEFMKNFKNALDISGIKYKEGEGEIIWNGLPDPNEDVVKVVRCKDCRHAWQSEDAFEFDGTPLCECGYSKMPNRWHEYCSWGDKRKQPMEVCLTCKKSLRGKCLYRECEYEPIAESVER